MAPCLLLSQNPDDLFGPALLIVDSLIRVTDSTLWKELAQGMPDIRPLLLTGARRSAALCDKR
jgi:hypothetical protein